MEFRKILVFDSTMRDGEQQPLLCFRDDEKIKLAYLLEETGIFEMDFMPSIDEHERMLISLLNDTHLRERIGVSTMLHKKYIDQAVEVNARVAFLFVHTSDKLIEARGKTREQNLSEIVDCVNYAISKDLIVDFCAGDGTRSDFGYIREILGEVGSRIRFYQHCDTAGVLNPEDSRKHIKKLTSLLGNRVVVHYHNDLGLASGNVLAALEEGAIGFDGTFLGIGERAGNVALESVLYLLRDSHGIYVEGINYDKIEEVLQLVKAMCRGINPPQVNPERRYSNVSGIHAKAILGKKDAFGLNYTPDVIKEHLYFGKHSGRNNYRLLFGDQFTDAEYERMRDDVKKLSREQLKDFTAQEIIRMYGGVRE